MKAKKKILILVCILVAGVLAAAGFLGYRKYQKSHTPDELLLKEKEEMEEAYELLFQDVTGRYQNYRTVVIINPAHGGSDMGNQSEYGTEKNITLSVAQKVIEQNTDGSIGIFLTRDTDTNPELEKRMTLAKAAEADLLIDLHVSRDSQNTIYGTRVFYQTDYFDNRLTNAAFADILEKSVVTAIEGYAGGIFEDEEKGYPVLSGQTIPAVCIEMGYLSNSTEGTLLNRDGYQQHLAEGILKGIKEAVKTIEEQEQ